MWHESRSTAANPTLGSSTAVTVEESPYRNRGHGALCRVRRTAWQISREGRRPRGRSLGRSDRISSIVSTPAFSTLTPHRRDFAFLISLRTFFASCSSRLSSLISTQMSAIASARASLWLASERSWRTGSNRVAVCRRGLVGKDVVRQNHRSRPHSRQAARCSFAQPSARRLVWSSCQRQF